MADLQELFARLNNGGAVGAVNDQNQQRYQQLTVSSPVFSPAPSGPQPHHQSAIISPNISTTNTPAPEFDRASQQTPQQQSANLLNLLRFNQAGAGQTRRLSSNSQSIEGSLAPERTVSASDLVASFMGKKSPAHCSGTFISTSPAPAPLPQENPQDLLLRLLNPKPAQSDDRSSGHATTTISPSVSSVQPEAPVDDLSRDVLDMQQELATPTPINASGTAGPRFTYVNPFDKLAAASPRQTPADIDKSASFAPKIEILKAKRAMETPATVVGNSKTKSSTHNETVAEAVTDLGAQVGQQVEDELAEAEGKHTTQIAVKSDAVANAPVTEVSPTFQNVGKPGPTIASPSKPRAAILKEVATEVASDNVADDWETAEAEENMANGEEQTVIVYRFPMRAFATIIVNQMPSQRLSFPSELFMDIARLKKEFDQLDRSLVSASKNFIVYALVKKGGLRIIRQENGQYRQVFENHHERIISTAVSTAGDDSRQPLESIIGTGVNGTVFWTSLDPTREDLQFGDNLNSQSLMIPPSPSQDEKSSTSQLKTRAKPSSRHPDFFAVGRGKTIHIIFPKVAAEYVRPKSRICHTEKYYKERSLKILTGKAGKDFAFSEDDTIILSVDKAGCMRFWDIRPLTEPDLGSPHNPPRQIEISENLLEYQASSTSPKSSPTSVFFFDKDKPYTKGIALRYVIIGMKQNHVFQLWDLGLGKAVQEIQLPHQNESDAICSVSFHPRTGIMAVAHPTRNTIFFIHISCPRYNLPVMSQAAYVSRLANKDARGQNPLPPVNATAIMTSITEYSFAPKGKIRSLQMLNEPAGPFESDEADNAALFELYVMHSNGVCVLRIRRSDLGWKKEGEPIHPKEAEEEGVITITQLTPAKANTDELSTVREPATSAKAVSAVSDKSAREPSKKESSTLKQISSSEETTPLLASNKIEHKREPVPAAGVSGGEQSEKKKKKRATAESWSAVSAPAPSAVRAPQSYAQVAQAPLPSRSPAPQEAESSKPTDVSSSEAHGRAEQINAKHLQPASSPTPAQIGGADLKKLEEVVQTEVAKGLDGLYKRFNEDRRVMNAANDSKQEAVLRLVSSTLTENVEGVIRNMVNENIRSVLLPEVLATLQQSVSTNLKSLLGPQITKHVPDAVSRALQQPQILQTLSDQVFQRLSASLEPVVTATVGSAIGSLLSNLTTLIDQQIGGQLRQAHVQRHEDATKIGQLTDTVHTCLETIQTMVANQAELQSQVARLQQSLTQQTGQALPTQVKPKAALPAHNPTPEEMETEAITALMANGNYDQGTMQWLQSNRTSELFDAVFVHCNPAYLSQVSPLLALSTGAVVSDSLERHLSERLNWLEAVFGSVNPNDAEIRDIVPKIMDVIKQRLTTAYIQLNESASAPVNPLLRRISTLVKTCDEMTHAAGAFTPRG